MSTSAGSTPGTPPSRMPDPPYTFSRYLAPSCTPVAAFREPRPEPGPVLHEDRVPVADQRLDSRRHQRYAVLGSFDLSRDSNDHARSVLRSCATPLRDAS